LINKADKKCNRVLSLNERAAGKKIAPIIGQNNKNFLSFNLFEEITVPFAPNNECSVTIIHCALKSCSF
jgi:hypothetical protein